MRSKTVLNGSWSKKSSKHFKVEQLGYCNKEERVNAGRSVVPQMQWSNILQTSRRKKTVHKQEMHPSRMRTVRSSGRISGGVCSRVGCLHPVGVSVPGGSASGGCCWGCLLRGCVSALGCVCSPGGSAPRGVVSQHALRQTPPPPCGQTDTCKNITFANFVCGR